MCCDVLQLQVSSMSDEVNRKLSYLHVSSNKMSDLQRLNVQLEVHNRCTSLSVGAKSMMVGSNRFLLPHTMTLF